MFQSNQAKDCHISKLLEQMFLLSIDFLNYFIKAMVQCREYTWGREEPGKYARLSNTVLLTEVFQNTKSGRCGQTKSEPRGYFAQQLEKYKDFLMQQNLLFLPVGGLIRPIFRFDVFFLLCILLGIFGFYFIFIDS